MICRLFSGTTRSTITTRIRLLRMAILHEEGGERSSMEVAKTRLQLSTVSITVWKHSL